MLAHALYRTPISLFWAALLFFAQNIFAHVQQPFDHLYQFQWVLSTEPEAKINTARLSEHLAAYDVIFFGELHGHPGVHLAQMELFKALYRRNPNLSLSMEQFERDTQHHLNDYLAGKIGEQRFMDQARAWDNYPTAYRPLIEYAKSNHIPVIAANAPKTAVTCVRLKSLSVLKKMPKAARIYVAKNIDTSQGPYREKFMAFLHNNASHRGGKLPEAMTRMSERSYTAQAVRDDTMAESIALHLKANPGRQVLHLNGSFHSESFLGTVERLAQRIPALKIAVINTITLGGDKQDWTNEDQKTGTILLLVGRLPDLFVQKKHEQNWSRKILQKRKESECLY